MKKYKGMQKSLFTIVGFSATIASASAIVGLSATVSALVTAICGGTITTIVAVTAATTVVRKCAGAQNA